MEEKNFVGILIMGFVAIIVGLSLFSGTGSIASNVQRVTTLEHSENQTITAPAAGADYELYGQAPSGTPLVYNRTGGELLTSGNYTISQRIGSDGLVANVYRTTAGSTYASTPVNVSYYYEPDGYISNSQAGGRSLAQIIVIFAALAIAAVGLWIVLGNKILDYVDY